MEEGEGVEVEVGEAVGEELLAWGQTETIYSVTQWQGDKSTFVNSVRNLQRKNR